MFVCTLTGRTWRRNSSRLCRTTLNWFFSPEIRHGAEEVNHTPLGKKKKRRRVVFLTTETVSVNLDSVCCPSLKKNKTLCLSFQLCMTSVSYWAQACTAMASLKRREGSCLMSRLRRGGKSWLTCCWTWRTDQSWRAERRMRTGSKVQSPVCSEMVLPQKHENALS